MKSKTSRKIKYPDCVGKRVVCEWCGGISKITKRTTLEICGKGINRVRVKCPFCKSPTVVENSFLKVQNEKLLAFVSSQVQPIKSIENDLIRLPMQRLLDSFYAVLTEEEQG